MATEKRLIDGNQLKTDMYLLATLGNDENIFIDVIIDEIDNADEVDAVEVKHGRWEYHDPVSPNCFCSVCNYDAPWDVFGDYHSERTNYCPNCGAKMDGDGNA